MNDVWAIVIPAYNPGPGLPAYVAALRAACPGTPILVVDDGSRPETQPVFRACAETAPDVEIAVHETNRGKGRALKTAFARLLERHPGLRGCVTCDCDGQHAPEDVAKCLSVLAERPGSVVLGCRSFDLAHVPWKSRWGNHSMLLFFRLVTGRVFTDTQTGLRGLPADFMRELLECPGERFEFETRMLLRLGRRDLLQIPIRTLYDDGNKGTHFKPVGDSAKIVGVLLEGAAATIGAFVLASLLSFGLDIALFALLFYRVFGAASQGRLFFAVLLSRAGSVVFNYACNRYFVFRGVRGDHRFDAVAFGRYIALAIAIMGASYALTKFFGFFLPRAPMVAVKAGVDAFLFLASYAVQRIAIFRHRDPPPP